MKFRNHFVIRKIIFTIILISFQQVIFSAENLRETTTPKSFKILALGDVITTGNSSVGAISYLFPLWEKLFAAGYVVEFVGSNSTTTRIGAIKQAAIGTETGTAETIDGSISATYTSFQADVVLIHAGHNHDVATSPIPSIIASHKSIISKIRTINPAVKIIVAQVIPSGKLPKYSYIPELNIELAKMAAEYEAANKPIALVNMVENFNWQTDCLGGTNMTHPNASGAEKIAIKFANAIKSAIGEAEESYNPEIVTYKQPTGASLKLHIFKPLNTKSDKKYPAIIYFFGGGWTSGTPFQFYREAYYLASRGMVAVCADYRIQYTHNTSPIESIKDAKSAIRWLRSNAATYNIDPDKICASGASAGGHLAAATGTLQLWDEPSENLSISSKPNLLLLNYPVYDNGPTGYGPTDFRSQYLTVSPLHNISATTPPCLTILGTTDQYIPVSTAQLFQQKMKDYGTESELILYQGAGHPIFSYQKGKSVDYYSILNQSEEFLIRFGFLSTVNTLPKSLKSSNIKIFPNPSKGVFKVVGLNPNEQLKIARLTGETIAIHEHENTYNMQNFPNNIYLLSTEKETFKLILKQ